MMAQRLTDPISDRVPVSPLRAVLAGQDLRIKRALRSDSAAAHSFAPPEGCGRYA